MRVVVAIYSALALLSGAVSVSLFIAGRWQFGLLGLVLVPVNASVAIYNYRSIRGHRTTAGNRDDPGTVDVADLSINPITPGNNAGFSWHHYSRPGLNPPYKSVWNVLSPPGPNPVVDPVPLPERHDDQPILAYKAARVLFRYGGKFVWTGIGMGGEYTTVAEAACELPGDDNFYRAVMYGEKAFVQHDAPSLTCGCGFYASQDRSLVDEGFGIVVLDVELYGRVIVHERGYRAEKQRVVHAQVAGCSLCGAPVTAGVLPRGYGGRTENDGKPTLDFRCNAHVHRDDVPFALDLLSARLGVPIEAAS